MDGGPKNLHVFGKSGEVFGRIAEIEATGVGATREFLQNLAVQARFRCNDL
jgi:hypothetical protein